MGTCRLHTSHTNFYWATRKGSEAPPSLGRSHPSLLPKMVSKQAHCRTALRTNVVGCDSNMIAQLAIDLWAKHANTWAQLASIRTKAPAFFAGKTELLVSFANPTSGKKKLLQSGECGALDYYYIIRQKLTSKRYWLSRLNLALQHALPLIFPCPPRCPLTISWPILSPATKPSVVAA